MTNMLKKISIIIFILLIFQQLTFASYRIYIGQDDYGKLLSGIEANIKITNVKANFDVCSLDVSNKYAEVTGNVLDFRPFAVKYVTEFIIDITEQEEIYFYHHCTHQIDGFGCLDKLKEKELNITKLGLLHKF